MGSYKERKIFLLFHITVQSFLPSQQMGREAITGLPLLLISCCLPEILKLLCPTQQFNHVLQYTFYRTNYNFKNNHCCALHTRVWVFYKFDTKLILILLLIKVQNYYYLYSTIIVHGTVQRTKHGKGFCSEESTV